MAPHQQRLASRNFVLIITLSASRRSRLLLQLAILFVIPAALQASRAVGDLSSMRGFNYTPANRAGHGGFWLEYDPHVVDHDLDLAVRLNLNQARVFVPYETWASNKASGRTHLAEFIRACREHNIGVMPVLAAGGQHDRSGASGREPASSG